MGAASSAPRSFGIEHHDDFWKEFNERHGEYSKEYEDFWKELKESRGENRKEFKEHMRLERARIERILSPEDTTRLMRMAAIYMNNQGKLLAYSAEDNTFCLVETVGNGDIPLHAMFAAPYYSCLKFTMVEELSEYLRPVEEDDRVRGELSAELSKYIWPLDQDAIHVQFKSPYNHHINFFPFYKVKVVFGNTGGDVGKYCLATCDDGTVKWLLPSECGSGNNVWTVYLFDDPCGRNVHLSQRLRRIGSNVHNGHVIHIGGNSNGSGGTQNIGFANLQIT